MTEWTEGAADAIGSVLRIELVATEHGFNDMTPGPTIEVNAGETLIVRFVNQRSRPSCFCLAGLRCTGTPAGETRAKNRSFAGPPLRVSADASSCTVSLPARRAPLGPLGPVIVRTRAAYEPAPANAASRSARARRLAGVSSS